MSRHPIIRTHTEPHPIDSAHRLPWLRAAVLGADDGIVSIAGLVVGVASATGEIGVILTSGIAGLVAGALSMAAGEYVSVSAERDSQKALLAKERSELAEEPAAELEELTEIYEGKGLSRVTAEAVARELTAHDAFAAHVETELKIDPTNLSNPWQAAVTSAITYTIGGLLPVLAITLPAAHNRIPVTFVAVLVALAITGSLSASASGAKKTRATLRVVVGGALAMSITYLIGQLFGVAGI